jgi:hypothetical protein
MATTMHSRIYLGIPEPYIFMPISPMCGIELSLKDLKDLAIKFVSFMSYKLMFNYSNW